MVIAVKKALLGLGVGYTVLSLGIGIYWILNPDKYGEWQGKFMNGMMSAFGKED